MANKVEITAVLEEIGDRKGLASATPTAVLGHSWGKIEMQVSRDQARALAPMLYKVVKITIEE